MNVFCFAGNITKDIDLKTTQGGKKVASFGVAINEGKDKTTFINCVAWEKTAELLKEYCSKGDKLSGTGRLEIRSYDKDGEKKYVTEIIVSQFDFPPKKQAKESAPKQAPRQTTDELEDEIPW